MTTAFFSWASRRRYENMGLSMQDVLFIHGGKPNYKAFFAGKIMKASKGKVNPGDLKKFFWKNEMPKADTTSGDTNIIPIVFFVD